MPYSRDHLPRPLVDRLPSTSSGRSILENIDEGLATNRLEKLVSRLEKAVDRLTPMQEGAIYIPTASEFHEVCLALKAQQERSSK